jgi:hypothetical protein
MSLTSAMPKSRYDIEREMGLTDKDNTKPLLLKIIEQFTNNDMASNMRSKNDGINQWNAPAPDPM